MKRAAVTNHRTVAPAAEAYRASGAETHRVPPPDAGPRHQYDERER